MSLSAGTLCLRCLQFFIATCSWRCVSFLWLFPGLAAGFWHEDNSIKWERWGLTAVLGTAPALQVGAFQSLVSRLVRCGCCGTFLGLRSLEELRGIFLGCFFWGHSGLQGLLVMCVLPANLPHHQTLCLGGNMCPQTGVRGLAPRLSVLPHETRCK